MSFYRSISEDKIVRIRRTGKWILLESLDKEVRKLSCDATKNDLNLLECSVIIYDDIQSEVTKKSSEDE